MTARGPVASAPSAFCTDPGMFRGRPFDLVRDRPDLTIVITDTCVADCDHGPIQIALQVANAGYADVAEGAVAAVYAVEEEGWREGPCHIARRPSGEALDGVIVDQAVGDVGALGLGARDEGNDATLATTVCA
jgi:hypothetical protein